MPMFLLLSVRARCPGWPLLWVRKYALQAPGTGGRGHLGPRSIQYTAFLASWALSPRKAPNKETQNLRPLPPGPASHDESTSKFSF